jgi:aldehyde:ferredoxin oxidoreductase
MLGYQNKVLRVDLTKKGAKTEPLRMDWAEKYIGSKGLAIKYMYEELKPGIDALSSDNKLFFTTGPMTGTPVPCSGKLSVAAKSPATGTMNDCSIGGHSALQIKYAGYDMIILEGALKEPGYLLIEDGNIQFKDAKDLWGKGSHETETILAAKYGHDYSILSIGPAGENLVVMSCINSDYYRQAGRGGIGAVMGSKKLKAIVIKGTGGVKIPNIVENTKKITEILREDVLQEDNTFIYDFGTTAFLEACSDGGIVPRKNFSDATDENWTKYNGEVLLEKRVGKRGCGSCGWAAETS